MTDLADRYSPVFGQSPALPARGLENDAPGPKLIDRVLKQLVRELLLAQSSDWAFLIKTGSAKEYATKRTQDHLLRFNRLHRDLIANAVNESFLCDCERRENLFPNVNWRYYCSRAL